MEDGGIFESEFLKLNDCENWILSRKKRRHTVKHGQIDTWWIPRLFGEVKFVEQIADSSIEVNKKKGWDLAVKFLLDTDWQWQCDRHCDRWHW